MSLRFLDSVLFYKMHTKKSLQKLREFLNNQITDVYEFASVLAFYKCRHSGPSSQATALV